MRHLINLYVSSWEWFEDRRGRAAALELQREPETKKVWTFLSQGAVGCGLGYFILVAGYAIYAPDNFNLFFCIVLPFVLMLGAVWGSFAGFFVWLAGAIFKRRLNAVHRTLVIVGSLMLFSQGVSYLINAYLKNAYLMNGGTVENFSLIWTVGLWGAVCGPIVWATGSKIRPGHLMLLGAGDHRKRYNLGDWLACPAGFFLRAVSILGFIESLLFTVLWVGARTADNVSYPAPEHLPPIIIAILYFFLSTYFSFATPRKAYLLATAIVVNLPLLMLLGYLRRFTSDDSWFLSYMLIALIGLWAMYTLGRLIAPEPTSQEIDLRTNFGDLNKTSPHWPHRVLS